MKSDVETVLMIKKKFDQSSSALIEIQFLTNVCAKT